MVGVKSIPVAQVPKQSKDELRAQVAKLEQANATLKAKSRETNRAAKAANARIAELEADLARLQEQASRLEASLKAGAVEQQSSRPHHREIDPGDAVPPGVAVLEPESLDPQAEAARDALEEHLSGE